MKGNDEQHRQRSRDVDDDTARTELARRLLEEYLNGLRAILGHLRRKLN